MAFFDTSSESLIASALAESRVVFLVGPRRSGLTHWVRRAFSRRLSEDDPGLAIDLAEHSTVNALRAELTNRFRLVKQPRHPRDLQVLLGATGERLVCLFLNAHRAAPDALDWLVSALLDSMAGGTGRGRSFLMEGAVDVDTVLDRTFGAGRPSVPLVEYAAPRTPWRSLVEIESLCDSRAKRHHPALAPWVADRSGGDLGLVVELLTGIPDTEILEDVHLEATCEKVVRSSGCSLEIATAATSEGEPGLAKRVISGLPIPAAPPPVLRSGALKDLYLAGIAEYDSILGGYRSRSPLVAQIVARALGFSDQEFYPEGAEIHARSSYLLWQIAHIELSLRSRVAGLDCCSRLAADARTLTQWSGLGNRIKGEAVRRDPAIRDVMGTLAEVLKEILPDRETILEGVERRLGIDASAMTDEDILSRLTLRELLEVASVGKIVGAADRAAIESLAVIRNDVAHLRPTSYDRMHRAVQNVRMVLRSVQGEN